MATIEKNPGGKYRRPSLGKRVTKTCCAQMNRQVRRKAITQMGSDCDLWPSLGCMSHPLELGRFGRGWNQWKIFLGLALATLFSYTGFQWPHFFVQDSGFQTRPVVRSSANNSVLQFWLEKVETASSGVPFGVNLLRQVCLAQSSRWERGCRW